MPFRQLRQKYKYTNMQNEKMGAAMSRWSAVNGYCYPRDCEDCEFRCCCPHCRCTIPCKDYEPGQCNYHIIDDWYAKEGDAFYAEQVEAARKEQREYEARAKEW
jgi:hypothetical protein